MRNRLEKLRNQSSATSNLEQSVVKTSFFDSNSNFPLVVKPADYEIDLSNWFVENMEKFEKQLLTYGAVLFRGFHINTVDKFQNLMDLFPKDLLEYNLRSSPRHSLVDNVYVSTTYPEDQIINMHSESSYAPSHPERIVFCCITPARERGETPIADNRKVFANLSTELQQKFIQKGVKYKRNLGGLLGLPWQEVFQTTDKKEAEAECYNNNIDFYWKNEDELILSWNKKGIWEHPQTHETTWFNHAFFFNKHLFNEDVLNSINSDDDLPNNTFFGDGTEITKQEIEEIKSAYEKSTIKFKWQKGDVLFLDNMLMSHGRNSYEGERKIIVSIS